MAESVLNITEIFRSIQGESTWAGLPCIFIRLAGCDVGCAYCDTRYAADGGTEMTLSQILSACGTFGGQLVEITGGEPLLQAGCGPLAEALLKQDYTVLIETSGTRPIGLLPPGTIRIMDLKCPGSGACERNDWSNIAALTPMDEVKFVIADRRDFDWSCEMVRQHTLLTRCGAVLFSPVYGRLEGRLLAEWILASQLPVRFQLQLHKCVWPADQRGV